LYYVYIVECKDGTLYTGCTPDIENRLKEHNAGTGCKYTRTRYPVVLRYLEEAENRSKAQQREYAIKQLSRKEKLEILNINTA